MLPLVPVQCTYLFCCVSYSYSNPQRLMSILTIRDLLETPARVVGHSLNEWPRRGSTDSTRRLDFNHDPVWLRNKSEILEYVQYFACKASGKIRPRSARPPKSKWASVGDYLFSRKHFPKRLAWHGRLPRGRHLCSWSLKSIAQTDTMYLAWCI